MIDKAAWVHRRIAAGVVGAVAVACSTLPDITPDTCGNHVLESGEDCDTNQTGADGTVCRPPGQADACRYGCGPDNANAPCPSGWGCGTDGVCRVAKGQYQPFSGEIASDAVSLGFADYDGDGLADLRETSATATRIRYGSTKGDLATFFRVPTDDPFPTTGDLNGDGLADLAFQLGGSAAVWLGSADRTLLPTPYPSFPLPDSEITFLPAEVLVDHPGAELIMFVPKLVVLRDTTNLAASDDKKGDFTLATTANHTPSDLAGVPRAGRFDESADSPCDWIVYGFKGESVVHVLPTCKGELPNRISALRKETLVLLPGGAQTGSGALISDLNGDGHLDLLIDAPLSGERNIVQALGQGDGTFAAPTSVNAYYVRFPLAVGQYTRGDSFPDFVDPTGNIVLVTHSPLFIGSGSGDAGGDASTGLDVPSVTTLAAPSNTSWSEAAILDVNENGYPDIVCAGQNQIDFYNGNGSTLLDHVGYPIDGAAGELAFGDFDGDLAIDIAYRERPTTSTFDSLKILFGNVLALPSPPVSLGTPGTISLVVAAVLGDTVLGKADGIGDLGLLLTNGDANAQFVSVFAGSSDRQLQSPYGLARPRPGAAAGADPFIHGAARALAIGNFTVSSPQHTDLGCVGADNDALDPGEALGSTDFRAWLVPATGNAELDPDTTTASSGKFDVVPPPGTSPGTLAWQSAQSVAVSLDATGGLDAMLTLVPSLQESHAAGALFFSHVANGAFAVTQGQGRVDVGVDTATTTGLPAAWRINVTDVNADGALDVLVFANTADGPRALVFINTRNGALGAPVTVPVPNGARATAAAALNADGDPQREIAVLTDKGIFIADPSAAGDSFTLADKPLAGLPTNAGTNTAIAAGDVDGDRIDDIVVLGNGVLQLFQGLPVSK